MKDRKPQIAQAVEDVKDEKKEEGITFANARKKYIAALETYSDKHESFADIITFLTTLRDIQKAIHAEAAKKAPAGNERDKLQRSFGNTVFDKGSLQLRQQSFSAEPRITALDTAEEKVQPAKNGSGGMFKQSTKNQATETTRYTITFSDNEQLSFTQIQLNIEKVRSDLAAQFENKMNHLQLQNSPR